MPWIGLGIRVGKGGSNGYGPELIPQPLDFTGWDDHSAAPINVTANSFETTTTADGKKLLSKLTIGETYLLVAAGTASENCIIGDVGNTKPNGAFNLNEEIVATSEVIYVILLAAGTISFTSFSMKKVL
jgi:hypothetical protein